MQEIKFYLFLGITLYGLCQYEQTTLAWVFLVLPLLYVGLKNIFISTFVTMAEQNVPHEMAPQLLQGNENNVSPQNNIGILYLLAVSITAITSSLFLGRTTPTGSI